MVKDEDVCLHCGLCAERCPTGAWDMQKFPDRHGPGGARMPAIDRDQARASTTSSSSSPTSTARARPAPTRCSPSRSCAWACRSRRATSSPPTSRACRPGTRCASPEAGHLGRARRRRPDGRDEPADLGPGRRRDRAGRLSVLRFTPSRCRRRSSATTSSSSACR